MSAWAERSVERIARVLARWQAYRNRTGRAITVWALRHLPAGIVARPMEWFLAILCTVTGVALMAGLSRPSAAENQLRPIAYYSWSLTLLVGGVAMIVGLTSIRWVSFPVYELRRVAEYQFGLRLLWIGCAVWSIVLIANTGIDAMLSASFAALFSFFCAVRLLTVRSRI
jgi:hypothetical protein